MATLQGAIDELIGVVGAVNGINYAPSDPTEQINAWPAAMVYATDGQTGAHGNDIQTDLHNIQIAVLMPANDMAQQAQIMIPFCEPITAALYAHRHGRTSENYETFSGVSYNLGPVEWPNGIVMYGFVFTVQSLKIQNNFL